MGFFDTLGSALGKGAGFANDLLSSGSSVLNELARLKGSTDALRGDTPSAGATSSFFSPVLLSTTPPPPAPAPSMGVGVVLVLGAIGVLLLLTLRRG